MAGEVLMVTARVRLDWSDPKHWSDTPADCRCCRTPTHGLDDQDRACHQSCAEDELAGEMAGQLGGRIVDERFRPAAPTVGGPR